MKAKGKGKEEIKDIVAFTKPRRKSKAKHTLFMWLGGEKVMALVSQRGATKNKVIFFLITFILLAFQLTYNIYLCTQAGNTLVNCAK